MIYFVYLFLLLMLLIIERNSKGLSNLCRVLIPIIYTLLIGCRGKDNGVDTHTYYEHYYTFGQWGCDFVEYGFDWINRFCFSMGWEANSLFLIMAAITCLFLYLSLERLKKKYYTITAFFVYLFTFAFLINGMRQGVAVAAFIYAYWFIIDRKCLWYVVLILFASLFHASALLLLPVYFLNRHHLSSKLYSIIYLISFSGLFINLSSYLPEIELGNRDYSNYAKDVNIGSASSLGFMVTTLLNIIVFYIMQKNKLFEKIPLLANLVFVEFFMKNIGFNIPIIGRITVYFSWFIFLLYPYIYYSCKFNSYKIKQMTFIVIFLINASVWLNALFNTTNKMLPYLFYWENNIH